MSHREQSSGDMAAKASRIMNIARCKTTTQRVKGPVAFFHKELREAFATTGGGDEAVLQKVDEVLRSYIDDAESLAASVLTQRERS